MERVAAYDTTLRDGAQQEGISLSVHDKLQLLPILDELGVTYIEGGWPGAIPKDTEFFQAAAEIPLRTARLVAFGSTRKAGVKVEDDPQIHGLLDSGAPIVTVVAKSHLQHVEKALHTSATENLEMVRDSVAYLGKHVEVMVDLEHFFDGLKLDPEYGIQVALAAAQAGASTMIPCDTNGGGLPHEIFEQVSRLRTALDEAGYTDTRIGIHAHNDTGCAVANTLMAVRAGARQIQGTVNGYGERTGNANLLTCIADLQLKMDYTVVPEESLQQFTSISHSVAEIVNLVPSARSPYVGASAFAHKAGLHASAIRVDPDLYQHLPPETVGNTRRMLVSEMSGRASIELKATELGIDLGSDPELVKRVVAQVKAREAEGYTYDAADASFALLLLDELGKAPTYWQMESWKAATREINLFSRQGCSSDEAGSGRARAASRAGTGGTGAANNSGAGSSTDASAGTGATNGERAAISPGLFTECDATVKLWTDRRHICTAEGVGPVNALDAALREALKDSYPLVSQFHLSNFKVRILDEAKGGTDATIRTLIDMDYGANRWTTVGVGTNIIETSYRALAEGYRYGLLAAGVEPLVEVASLKIH